MKEEDLEAAAMEALLQIDKMQYEASLMVKGVKKEKIRKYGFAFEESADFEEKVTVLFESVLPSRKTAVLF